MNKEELLQKLDKFLADKGLEGSEQYLDSETKLKTYGLPALEATKGILYDIYSYEPPTGSSLLRKMKNKIINLIRNVTISTMELLAIKQNKFNELTYQFIELLVKENQDLKERVAQLEKDSKHVNN